MLNLLLILKSGQLEDIKKFLKENGEKEVDEIVSTADHLYGDLIRDFECTEQEPEDLYDGLQDLIEEIQALLEDDRIQNSPIL